MAYVNFGRKNTREEALASTNKDKIFFPTDANTIIMGGREFGGGGGSAVIVPDVELECNSFIWDEGAECKLDILPKQAVVNITVTSDNPIVTVSNITRNGFTLSSSEPRESTTVNIEVRVESGSVVITKNASIRVMKRIIINGHEAVDLGLPSGTLWATCNIGADTPYTYEFTAFQWRETEGNHIVSFSLNGRYYDEEHYDFESISYDISPTSGYDAAREKWGDRWRMPTRADAEELKEYCAYNFVTVNSIRGLLLTSKINGQTIFIPACGYCTHYWSSGDSYLRSRGEMCACWTSTNMSGKGDNIATAIRYFDGYFSPYSDSSFYEGLAIRPVI